MHVMIHRQNKAYPKAIDCLRRRGASIAIVLACAVLLAGCDRAGPRRVEVTGTVTLDGLPLTAGTVRFLSVPGTPPVVCDANLQEGQYLISASKGPLPGKYRVEIGVPRKTGRKVQNSLTQQITDEMIESLPERYNCRSKLTAEVTDTGSNRFEFALTSH